MLADLEAGEAPLLLADLARQSFVPRGRGGKRLHPSCFYRWSGAGKNGVKLEVVNTPSGTVTTQSAVLRFFAALSAYPAGATGQVRRQHQRSERELDALGIGCAGRK